MSFVDHTVKQRKVEMQYLLNKLKQEYMKSQLHFTRRRRLLFILCQFVAFFLRLFEK